jgi:hypothetical protein
LLLNVVVTTTLGARAEAEGETMVRSSVRKLETTLGELISAVSDAALEVCNDKDAAYLLASIALEDLLENDVRRVAQKFSFAARERRRKQTITLRPAGL